MKNKLDESKWVGFIIVFDELFPREIQKKFDFFEFWIQSRAKYLILYLFIKYFAMLLYLK